MRKAYLLVYSSRLGSRAEVTEWLNAMPKVINWRFDMPNCYYLISESSATELSVRLREIAGKDGRFLVSEITSNKSGWLPKETWNLIRNKRGQPKTT